MNKDNEMKQDKTPVMAKEIACKVAGDLQAKPDIQIYDVSGAASVDSKTLTYAENEDFLQQALENEAALILLEQELYRPEIPAIICQNPRLAYARAADIFPDERYYDPGISDNAQIDEQVSLGKDVSLHEGVIINGKVSIGDKTRIAPGCLLVGKIEIGADCLLHPGVKILSGTKIGDRVEIQSGSVIGSDGFGYATYEAGNDDNENGGTAKHYKIPQQGEVIIEDDVELGALTAVDRAMEGVTRIGAGSKIDNLVQISHNVKIGSANLIAGQSGIAGSSCLGNEITLAGQVGVEDHVSINDDVTVTGKAKVSKNIKKSGFYSGIPVMPHREYLHKEANLRKVPKLREKVKELSNEIELLKEELENVQQ